jgi:endonuclease YncB( thermonuclease family)
MRLQSALPVAAAVLLLAGTAFAADQVEWRVVYVADGDTITCLDEGNKQHRIRIDGIDAPERGQPFGTVARDRMIALTKGKTATIHAHGNDRYGRLLSSAEIEHADVADRLVAEGLAWHYSRYSKDAAMAAAERDARAWGQGTSSGPQARATLGHGRVTCMRTPMNRKVLAHCLSAKYVFLE